MDRQRNLFLFPARWQRSNWQAMAIVLLALLVASNAAWLHASRSDDDAGAFSRQLGHLPSPERVIYEYPKPAVAAPAAPKLVAYRSTPLEAGERCAGDQVIRRLPNGWEGTNRPCNP
ncbi:hypothetical protein LU699_17550 [Luteimonas fraxinea]|uniref:Uncharacterized protein n=1 Tax=Luteimonas fraxinea TaxID=2901869 RepID=A0ABS8UCE8_9GAMM|nr:hypothetical protein [Luteimonas fraxinea]MCD9096560.1 hypothetical protein [Luteimonas fraxinea]MCD9125893.1 hypothetical protein [Luteimonas fraxinea]UHH10033.1 hypothetical protein LU699_17550 [Luteimonas fraxinea]